MHTSLETTTIEVVDVQSSVKHYLIVTVLRRYYSIFIGEKIQTQKHKRPAQGQTLISEQSQVGPRTIYPPRLMLLPLEKLPLLDHVGGKTTWVTQRECKSTERKLVKLISDGLSLLSVQQEGTFSHEKEGVGAGNLGRVT